MTVLLFIGAVIVTAVAHILSGWIWALAIPLMYVLFAPNTKQRAWMWASAITILSWSILFIMNFFIAAQPTVRAIHTMMGLIQPGVPGFILPMISLIFATLIGMLTGWLGSGIRTVLMNQNNE